MPPVPRCPPPPPPAGPGPPAPCGRSITTPSCVASGVINNAMRRACKSAESKPQPRRSSRLTGSPTAGSGRCRADPATEDRLGLGNESIGGCCRATAAPRDMESYTADDPKRVRPPHENPASERYFAAGAAPGVSLGGIPMILTPAPRATSIAKMTSPYGTPGAPFTKMIFSGRGS